MNIGIFGGEPLFERPRPIGQLAMPPIDRYLAAVREVWDRRVYTGGPFAARLEARLASEHGVRHCMTVANAGLGLMMLLRRFGAGRPGDVLMPSFSYRGLPHFAQWAGHQPRFCDVRHDHHGLDPARVEATIDERTRAILAVCNFNSAGDVDALATVAARHRLPIVFDSVYAIGSRYHGRPLGGNGDAEVFSMHATKLLNGFEGGYITTNDDALAADLRRQLANRMPNATLNELHAAMAWCSLDELDAVIERNRARYEAYRANFAGLPGLQIVPYADAPGDRSNYELVVLDVAAPWPLTRDETARVLRAEGAVITAYYSPALHRSPHAPLASRDVDLPVTDALATRFLQVPVGELVSLEDIARLGERFALIARDGEAVAERLRALPA